MRISLLVVALTLSAVLPALSDNGTLSQWLIGTWDGSRHHTRYFADGKWMMDPQNYQLLGGQNTHGKWRIENGRLIETWRFLGQTSDSITVGEIIELTNTTLKIRTLSQEGPGRPQGLVLPSGVYTLKRVPNAKLPGEK